MTRETVLDAQTPSMLNGEAGRSRQSNARFDIGRTAEVAFRSGSCPSRRSRRLERHDNPSVAATRTLHPAVQHAQAKSPPSRPQQPPCPEI